MVVILNDSLQIIDNPMEENIVVRNRGGGCIVVNAPLFSVDGKYIYVLSGCCISAYSVHTGERSHDYVSKNKEEFSFIATFQQYLLGVTSAGRLTVWDTRTDASEKSVELALAANASVVQVHTFTSKRKNLEFELLLAVQEGEKKDLQLLNYSSRGKLLSNLYARADHKPHSVSVCDEFVAVIKKDRLTVVSFENEKNSMLAGGGRQWMVVVCAPDSCGVAAGDDSGRILYWPQALRSNARGVFHWHTLPVAAITFSASGSYMYSGGGEGVMVRWNLEVSNVRNFLPRLPAPILHLTVSSDNQYIAIATQDNGIQLVDSQSRVCSVIQKLTWGVTPVAGQPLFPAGLVWDPRSRSIVLNGRPGHLQFFSTDDDKLLYNLDITGQNYLTQERDKEIINVEVTRVAVSYDGKWLVTVESRDDQQTFRETLLKFWQYKFNARQFSLNTCIQQPHLGVVTSAKFQPQPPDLSAERHCYLLVTTGTDGKFRLWLPSTSESIHSEGLRWVCDSVGYYRTLSPECASFSADGSVLGITFGPSLTLWDAEICQLSTSMTRDSNVLRAVEFGSQEYCHLVVTASDWELCVWSILTLTIMWATNVRTSQLCADPLSSFMAVFTADNCVFVFSPSNAVPVYEKKEVCKARSSVMAALFVPRPHKLLDTTATWCSNSQLHFINSNQELHYLELESEPDPEQSLRRPETSAGAAAVTPFTILAAKHATSDVERAQGIRHEQFGTAGDAAVRKLLSMPANTMPHIHLFCKTFLKSLAVTGKTEEEKKSVEESELDIKMEVVEDGDIDSEVESKSNNTSASTNKWDKEEWKRTRKSEVEENGGAGTTSPKKELKEILSKKKPRHRSMKSPRKTEYSFSFDDLDTDWFSGLETR